MQKQYELSTISAVRANGLTLGPRNGHSSTVSELRVSYDSVVLSEPITNSKEAHKFLMEIWDGELINLKEQFYVIFLNGGNKVISWRLCATGDCKETFSDVKFIFACALRCMASKIIISHNHPSGNLKPSPPDIKGTANIKRVAEMLEMELLDHVIVAGKDYYSFKDNELIC